MKNIVLYFNYILLYIIAMFGLNSFIIDMLPKPNGTISQVQSASLSYETPLSSLTSNGDFLALYADLTGTNSSTPFNIDIVGFSAMNGSPTTISNALDYVTFPGGILLPSNTSAFNNTTNELAYLKPSELITYDDNSMNANLISLLASSTTAPVFFQGKCYAIQIEDNGFGQGPLFEADINDIHLPTGTISSTLHVQSTANPYSFFNYQYVSSATNGIDEMYFLSGSNLIIVTDLSIFNPMYCWKDLAPFNNQNSSSFFYGVEYKSPGVLLAIRESIVNGLQSGTDLVEIHFNSTNCTIGNINVVYDLQNNVTLSAGGWTINNEFYSTAYNTCDDTYYITTMFDQLFKSKLIEIDLQAGTHVEQILPFYLFGVEWKPTIPCPDPCQAAFTYELNDGCHIAQFYNQSVGTNLTYSWDFGESSSGQNNTSNFQDPVHQYSTCGTYNVCLTITGPDCNDVVCHSLQLTDVIPPVALCKSGVVINMDASCSAFLHASDIDGGSYDNCQLGSLNILPPVFNQCGYHNVTFTVTDWCGNTDVCNTVIEVVESIPPTITCPGDVYLTSTDDVCMIVVNGIQWLSLSDNCGIPSVSYKVTGASNFTGIGDASGLTFNQGTSVVCYTATDICGNTATCSFNVVLDCPCVCPMNIIQNPGFSEGIIGPVIGGPLLGSGQTDYWLFNGANTSFPYVNATKGCCDPVSIEFGGTSLGYSSIYQAGLSFLSGHHYKISFCAERLLNNNFQYAFVAANGPIIPGFSPYTCSNCDFIGVNSVNPQTGWVNFTLPIWTPTQNWDVLFIRPFTYYTVGGIDNVCVEEVFYICCGDENAFIENINNAVGTYSEQETWEGVLKVGSLMECNLIDYIKWGDGAVTDGPIGGNAVFRHEYTEPGTYQVEYKVREFDPQDSSQTACFEHIFIDDIVIFPDTCFCGEYSNMFITWDGGQAQEVACGGSPVPLGCPGTGVGYDFTGLFYCNGTICPDESNVIWVLNGPGGSFSGSSMANPYFGVTILPSYVSLPGVYTLSLSGACGSNSCMCTIQFIVDCPVLCPCSIEDIQALSSAVDMGFSQATQSISCIACFSPNAISSCETVEWHVGTITPTPLASTNGNQTFCYDFHASGSYTIIMVVKRKKSNGDDCETFTYSRQINISCQNGPQCNDPRIVNPNFSDDGSVPGGLNSGGSTLGWIGAAGNPVVKADVQGSHDGWVVALSGNHDYSDVLQSKESICIPPTGAITLRFSISQTFPVRHLVVKVTLVSGFEIKTIGALKLTEMDSSNWWESEFPFDVTDWIGSELCDDNEASVPVYIQLSVYNEFGDNQGGPLTFSEILIDNVCIDNMVSSSSPISAQAIKLFPNPNGGEFAIEFPETVHQGTSLQIIDITGQVLIEKKVEIGATLQHIDAYNLPQGIYFLRVLLNEKIISFERFIKL